MTAPDLTTDQEALRDEIAQALTGRRIGVYKSGLVQDAPIPSGDARFLASAVLPIVTRREAALRKENDEAWEQISGLQDKVDAMNGCACAYDGPHQSCMIHHPVIALLRSERDQLVEKINALADEFEIDSRVRADLSPLVALTRNGCYLRAAQRLRGLVSGDNQAAL